VELGHKILLTRKVTSCTLGYPWSHVHARETKWGLQRKHGTISPCLKIIHESMCLLFRLGTSQTQGLFFIHLCDLSDEHSLTHCKCSLNLSWLIDQLNIPTFSYCHCKCWKQKHSNVSMKIKSIVAQPAKAQTEKEWSRI
jgi:hypothetical protein